jgi:hypothetical protein
VNDILNAIADDLRIHRFHQETDDSFAYRLCYSALGQWCLSLARNSSNNDVGTSKKNKTSALNNLIDRYCLIFPSLSDKFVSHNNQRKDFSNYIFNIYNETGYLLIKDNKIVLANYGRNIKIGNQHLFFGIPDSSYAVNGLGIFSNNSNYTVTLKDFLIRDDLTWEEYFSSKFDLFDFIDIDIDSSVLEFFDPRSNWTPSQSWGPELKTDFSLARESVRGPYYQVTSAAPPGLKFVPINPDHYVDSFVAREYRRLIFALKAHYESPLPALIVKIDDEYSLIRLKGLLPNREYYLLLLISWPQRNAFDQTNFIIKNDFLIDVISVLKNIGIKIVSK